MASLTLVNGITSVIGRVVILDGTSTTGGRKTGLTFGSAGLIVSAIADNEAVATAYAQAAGKIETVTTLGTFAAPTVTKCRFKEVDPTNHPGLYEYQLADARWAVSGARYVVVSILGASGMVQVDEKVQLYPVPADLEQILGQPYTPLGNVDGYALDEAIRLILAAVGGKTSGFLPNTVGTGRIRDTADTKDRIVAGYDKSGNRTAVTLDATP